MSTASSTIVRRVWNYCNDLRDDCWASTSNNQLSFVQHIKTILKVGRRAAMVGPDNGLFEGNKAVVMVRIGK